MDGKVRNVKKPNPRATANPLSAVTFSYMLPIFHSSFKHGLKEDDLFEPLDEHRSNILGDNLESAWNEQHKKNNKFTLHRALLQIFGLELAIIGLFKLINEIALIIAMPYSIRNLVSYFESGPPKVTENQAYMAASFILVTLLLDCFISHYSMMAMMHIGMKLRIACSSLIYRKSLRLSQSALAKTTIGQLVNLLSNDVSKFEQDFVLFHFAWIAPIQTAVGTYLLYLDIGLPALIGMAFLLSFIPLQIWLGKRTSVLRLRAALRTDERVRLMNEIIAGIQVIKMYTWEKPFAKLISIARRKEINAIRSRSYMMSIVYSFEMFITRTSIFISILSFILLGNNITAEIVFSITAVYNVLRTIITMLFSISISSIAEVNISILRLQKFMNLEEVQNQKLEYTIPSDKENSELNGSVVKIANGIPHKCPRITLKEVSAQWLEDISEPTLSNISINVEKSSLVAVVGPVGSGKSSLFSVLLKELTISKGILEIDGRISYASQQAWLFSGSVRQNILFGDKYDEDRYRDVIKLCALEADLAMFPYGDRTLVGEKGKSLSGGQKARINLARCVYKQADIYLLDDPLSAVDTNVGKQLYDECIKTFLNDKICILITHQLQYLNNADHIIILTDGKILAEGKYQELQNTGLDFAKLLEEFQEEQEDGDKKKIKSRQHSEVVNEDTFEEPELEEEHMSKGSINLSVYWTYFKAGGGFFIMTVLVLSFFISQWVANSGDYFLTYWVNLEQDFNDKNVNNTNNVTLPRDNILYIYSGITGGTIVMALFHSMFFFAFMMRASVNLHDYIFDKISYATMKFFNANPSGRILNRFSKDLGVIDERIPNVLFDVVEITLMLTGTIVLTSIVNPWLVLPSLILIAIFYLARIVYLATSRSVKRIEGITRSPIFGHMSATIQGLATIRAFSAEGILSKEFDCYQDHHSSAWFLFIASSRTFGFWLDMICVVFIALVIFSLLLFDRGYYGGDVGLVVTQYLGLTGALQWGMRQWSELENSMISAERILEYTKVETEPVRKDKESQPPSDWPKEGKITFKEVSMRYDATEPVVLNKLNYTIHSREKVGIVGRTGAGKSSTIAALFQLYDIDGALIIDDLDTTKLSLEQVRSRISIIPQEPVLFSGTMRKNLDPFDEYNDDILWHSLDQVELKDVINELPAGLSSNVFEGGSNFSVGQRQLVCLARAIIRNNKILVMDEATANVDPHTDSLIQKTIRKSFMDCTVLTIAHRLHTIMDSDRVLVMDSGKVVEFDLPYTLLQNEDGYFYKLVQTTGKTTAKNLRNIAKESFMKMKQS